MYLFESFNIFKYVAYHFMSDLYIITYGIKHTDGTI